MATAEAMSFLKSAAGEEEEEAAAPPPMSKVASLSAPAKKTGREIKNFCLFLSPPPHPLFLLLFQSRF